MNIAHSASTSAAKNGAGLHHAKGLPGAGGVNAGDQGFMSLFSALDADGDGDSLVGAGKDGKDGLATLSAALGGADGAGLVSSQPTADPLALAAQANSVAAQAGTGGAAGSGQDAAAMALATDGGRTVGALNAAAEAKTGGANAATAPLATGADGEAQVQPGPATSVPAGEVTAAHARARPDSDLMKALRAQLQATDTGTPAGTVGLAGTGSARSAADAQKADGAAGASGAAAKVADAQRADMQLATQWRVADASRQAEAQAQKTPGAEVLMLAAQPDGALRDVQRSVERSASPSGSAGADAGTPGQGFAVTHGAIIEKPSASVDVLSPQATPDVQVAEQVSYWVSKDVQNAELKLDGLGAKPVEVSISVVGQEAHVEFRTDQPEIRQVLENAMPHLKEMLQGEGLTLAGTTVGTSAQGGQASQEQRDRAETRQARMALASLTPTAAGGRAVDSGMGSAVDYFV